MAIHTRTFDVYGVPPSMNRHVGRASRHAFTKLKRTWQDTFGWALLAALPGDQRPLPSISPVGVAVELRFTKHRRRDVENFRVLLSKALGDALVQGRWLADDTQEDWELKVLLAPDTYPQPSTVVAIAWETA